MYVEEPMTTQLREIGTRRILERDTWCMQTGDDKTWIEVDFIEIMPDGTGVVLHPDTADGLPPLLEDVTDQMRATLPPAGTVPSDQTPKNLTADDIAALLKDAAEH